MLRDDVIIHNIFDENRSELEGIARREIESHGLRWGGMYYGEGSLTLLLIAEAIYPFLKDYKDLREGTSLLIEDLQQLTDKLRQVFLKLFNELPMTGKMGRFEIAANYEYFTPYTNHRPHNTEETNWRVTGRSPSPLLLFMFYLVLTNLILFVFMWSWSPK